MTLPSSHTDDKVERYFYNKSGLRNGIVDGENQLFSLAYDDASNIEKESHLQENRGKIEEVIR